MPKSTDFSFKEMKSCLFLYLNTATVKSTHYFLNNENVRQEVYGQSEIDEMESLRKIAFSRLRDCKTKLPTSIGLFCNLAL